MYKNCYRFSNLIEKYRCQFIYFQFFNFYSKIAKDSWRELAFLKFHRRFKEENVSFWSKMLRFNTNVVEIVHFKINFIICMYLTIEYRCSCYENWKLKAPELGSSRRFRERTAHDVILRSDWGPSTIIRHLMRLSSKCAFSSQSERTLSYYLKRTVIRLLQTFLLAYFKQIIISQKLNLNHYWP